jgi:hypothetical protein
VKLPILFLGGVAAWVCVAAADDNPIFPPPQSTPKFKEVEVTVAHEPTVTPLEVERRLRWRAEKELTARKEPNFKLGANGLRVEIKFIHLVEPKLPVPQVWRPVPGPGGTRVMMPQTPPMPVPPIGEARLLLTFKESDGTKLSQFDIVQPVPFRMQWDEEEGYIAITARIVAEYARHYFLDKPAK